MTVGSGWTLTENVMVRPAVCPTCPFTMDLDLRAGRKQGIADALLNDQGFTCHHENIIQGKRHPRQCAGAVTVLMRMGLPNQLTRIAGRLGESIPDDPRVPHQTLDEWVADVH